MSQTEFLWLLLLRIWGSWGALGVSGPFLGGSPFASAEENASLQNLQRAFFYFFLCEVPLRVLKAPVFLRMQVLKETCLFRTCKG